MTHKRILTAAMAAATAALMGAVLGCPTTTTVETRPYNLTVTWSYTRGGQAAQCTPGWTAFLTAGTTASVPCERGTYTFEFKVSQRQSQTVKFLLKSAGGQGLSQEGTCDAILDPSTGTGTTIAFVVDLTPLPNPATVTCGGAPPPPVDAGGGGGNCAVSWTQTGCNGTLSPSITDGTIDRGGSPQTGAAFSTEPVPAGQYVCAATCSGGGNCTVTPQQANCAGGAAISLSVACQ